MKKRYVIFDFDGTLVDTNEMIIESWQGTFMHYLGHRMDEDDIVRTFGEVLIDTIRRLIPGADAVEARDFYRDYQEQHCLGMMRVFDGIPELLSALRSRGYKLGIATSRTAESYRKLMDELGLAAYIDEEVTARDVSTHKPHPEAALRILEKLGAKPEEAIFVGDTKYDIGCANAAGIDSVLVGWSHKVDMEQLEREGFAPDYIAERPEDLLLLLQK